MTNDKRAYMATFVQELPYSKTDKVAAEDNPLPIKPRVPAKQPHSVPARSCALSKGCTLRKAGRCTPVHCAAAYSYVANAPADLPAVAGKVRRDVGQEQEVDRG